MVSYSFRISIPLCVRPRILFVYHKTSLSSFFFGWGGGGEPHAPALRRPTGPPRAFPHSHIPSPSFPHPHQCTRILFGYRFNPMRADAPSAIILSTHTVVRRLSEGRTPQRVSQPASFFSGPIVRVSSPLPWGAEGGAGDPLAAYLISPASLPRSPFQLSALSPRPTKTGRQERFCPQWHCLSVYVLCWTKWRSVVLVL